MDDFDIAMNEATEDIIDALGGNVLIRTLDGLAETRQAVKDHDVQIMGRDGVIVTHNTTFTFNDQRGRLGYQNGRNSVQGARLKQGDRIRTSAGVWYEINMPIEGDHDSQSYSANPIEDGQV